MLTRGLDLYDANHVVYQPKTFTPDQLLEGYYGALKEVYTYPVHLQAAVGHDRVEKLFGRYPMNFAFRGGVKVGRGWRAARRARA
jgi:hypothetical protein